MTLAHIGHPRFQVEISLRSNLSAQGIALAVEMRDRVTINGAMGRLSSRQLRDIGLTRNDLDAACSGRPSDNAATELRQIASARAGNW